MSQLVLWGRCNISKTHRGSLVTRKSWVASDSNWKNNKIRIPKYISNLGVFLGRKWPNRFAWSETRTLNSLSTVLKLKEPTTLVFFSFFIDSSHTWLKWRPRIAVFRTLPPCHPDGVVLHFQCMIFRTLTPHAPDHWCCASCTYCFCLGSLALLMDGFPVKRGPGLFGQQAPSWRVGSQSAWNFQNHNAAFRQNPSFLSPLWKTWLVKRWLSTGYARVSKWIPSVCPRMPRNFASFGA